MPPALGAVPATRAGITATEVRRCIVDRLVWQESQREASTEPPRGQLDRHPAARGRFSALHRATDRGGHPAWVRRSDRCLTDSSFAAGHAAALDLAIGATVPPLRRIEGDGIWIDRLDWIDGREPSLASVDAYVAAALRTPLHDGVIVASGEPHVLQDGSIVVEDVLVAVRLETSERRLLTAALLGLAAADPVAAVDAIAELCRARPPGLADAARRCAVADRCDWTPAALGLTLHHVATAASRAGPRSEPLVLLADEFLHRLDFAHVHHVAPRDLSTPRSVKDLLLSDVAP